MPCQLQCYCTSQTKYFFILFLLFNFWMNDELSTQWPLQKHDNQTLWLLNPHSVLAIYGALVKSMIVLKSQCPQLQSTSQGWHDHKVKPRNREVSKTAYTVHATSLLASSRLIEDRKTLVLNSKWQYGCLCKHKEKQERRHHTIKSTEQVPSDKVLVSLPHHQLLRQELQTEKLKLRAVCCKGADA